MSFFNRLKNPALVDLVKDQRLKELLARREFRVSEEYVHREFISRAGDDEIRNPALRFFAGYGELSGEVKKRLVPFAIPFSVRFELAGVEFNPMGKRIHLKVSEIRPVDLDWVTKRVVAKVPFLTYSDGMVVCDLSRVPRLEDILAYRVGGIRLVDFVTLKELVFREGELAGRLGVIL